MLTSDRINLLHSRWETLTGYQVPLTIPRHDAWQAWAREVAAWIKHVETPGLTIRDCLDGVVEARRKQFADKPHTFKAVLKFSHLVEQPDKAVNDLAVWHAGRRARRAAAALDTGKERAIREAGLQPQSQGDEATARSAGQVLGSDAILAALAACKAEIAAAPSLVRADGYRQRVLRGGAAAAHDRSRKVNEEGA